MKPPHVLLALSELPRALADATLLQPAIPLLRKLPRGTGQAVMVLPGFMASDRGNQPLIRFLNSMGYNALGWGQGQNRGQQNFSEDSLRERMTRMMLESRGKITLVGHSLGGLYAREIAKQQPDVVEQVITLGSPFEEGRDTGSHASQLYQRMNPNRQEEEQQLDAPQLSTPPPVPTTAIYTRADGVVNWKTSIQRGNFDHVHNIEVLGSHIGLNMNPGVWYWILKKLDHTTARAA